MNHKLIDTVVCMLQMGNDVIQLKSNILLPVLICRR